MLWFDPCPNRLTQESIHPTDDPTDWGTATGSVQYDSTPGYGDNGYDQVGNRRLRTVTSFPQVTTTSYADYSPNDWLGGLDGTKVASLYDDNGNTIRFNLDGDSAYDQTDEDVYDHENRLVECTRAGTNIRLYYDADGNRIRKVVDDGTTVITTRYLVDDINPTGYAQVLEEQDVFYGVVDENPIATYVYGLDLVSQTRGTRTHYYGYDGLGTVRYLTDGNAKLPDGTTDNPNYGSVTDTYTYDAFGILIERRALHTGGTLVAFADPSSETPPAGTQPVENAYRYTGEQWDADLGMYYLRARYYHPQLGRFWTMDSYEGNNQDPLSLHKYLYTHNNPICGIDPSGQDVYVVTRPLNMKLLSSLRKYAVHVYLAFDGVGLTNVSQWFEFVRSSDTGPDGVNSLGITYASLPLVINLTTFSFHPLSVFTDNASENIWGTTSTTGSYIAYNDRVDLHAFFSQGTGYRRISVASGQDIQTEIYRFAIRSRFLNNSGTPDPNDYEFTYTNCGSWVKHVLDRFLIPFPDYGINQGVGLGANAGGLSGAALFVTGAAQEYRASQNNLIDFYTPLFMD